MEKDVSEIAKLTERILKDPKSKLFVPLAEEYKKLGQIDMAVSVLSEGLRNNPGYATARSFLGRLLLDQGNLAGAQKELEEVVKAIPDNLLAQRKLGDIFVLLGKPADALVRYKTALALNASDKELASLVSDMEAGKDISGRIPKPKVQEPPVEARTTPVPQKPAAPASVSSSRKETVPPAVSKPPFPPAGATTAVPGMKTTGEVKPASAPISAGSGAVPPSKVEKPSEAELVEEILEIEPLEPTVPQRPPLPSPVGPAETLPPLKSADQEQSAIGAFDLSESPSAFDVAGRQPDSWDASEAAQPVPNAVTPVAELGKDDINTDTLAELYIAQGFYDKAVEIYQRRLAERPNNNALQQKVLQLQALAGGPQTASAPFSAPPPVTPDMLAGRVHHTEPEARQIPQEVPVISERSAGLEDVLPERSASPPRSTERATEERATENPSISSVKGADELRDKRGFGNAATRRKETIDRLESWLKNVLKEKKE